MKDVMNKIDHVPDGYKIWTRSDGHKYIARSNSCFFCKHCTDIFWDYTNGPYMFFCDEMKSGIKEDECEYNDQLIENGLSGNCELFKEG